MPIKLKKTNIQYDIDTPENGYVILGFDENGNLVTKNSDGEYEPIINDISTGNFVRLEVDYLTVGNRVSGVAEGLYSIAQGLNISASGDTAYAQGNNAVASNLYTYARGEFVEASGVLAYVSGRGSGTINKLTSSGLNSFVHSYSLSGSHGSLANYSAILGGTNHDIGSSSESSVIIGGNGNFMLTGILRSVILGGNTQEAKDSDTVYIPRIKLANSTAPPNAPAGSIYYDGSNFYGHNGTSAKRLDIALESPVANSVVTVSGTLGLKGNNSLTWNGSLLSTTGNITCADLTTTDDIIVGDDLTVNGAIYGTPFIDGGLIYSNTMIQISRSLASSDSTLFNITNTGLNGDAAMLFDCGDEECTVGIDDSDGDKFKIYYNPNLGTSVTRTILESSYNASGYMETYLHGSTHIEHNRDFEPVLTIQNTNYSSDNDPALLHMIRDWNTTTTYLNYVRFYRGNGTIYDGGINVHSYTPGFINGSSDIRRKTGITMWEEDALDILNNLPVKSFYYIDDLEKTEKTTGWIAQEVQPLIPNMVIESGEVPDDDPDNPYLTIMPSTLYPYFHKSIQQLSSKIVALEQRVYELENPV